MIVTLTMPYIPGIKSKLVMSKANSYNTTHNFTQGFLAFREVEHYLKVYQKLIVNKPELTPQVVLIDGNGILHPRGFGLASHFGVLANTCTIGVAKNLHHLGDHVMRDDFHLAQIEALKEAGDRFLLENTHETIGAVTSLFFSNQFSHNFTLFYCSRR
jgi:deoxyinosine 3'endonuclease (endonuclease V)